MRNKKQTQRKERERCRYYPDCSLPKGLPRGRVIVHNLVLPTSPEQTQGDQGFRFWSQYPTSRLERCNCGWSGLEHYRIKRSISSKNYPGRTAAIEAFEKQMRRKGKDIFGRKLLTGSTATA